MRSCCHRATFTFVVHACDAIAALRIAHIHLCRLSPAAVFMTQKLAEFKSVFDDNIFGAFAAIQAFLPLMKVRHPKSVRRVERRCWRAVLDHKLYRRLSLGMCACELRLKEGGRTVVIVISSSAASTNPTAAAARNVDVVPGLLDVIVPAYRASCADNLHATAPYVPSVAGRGCLAHSLPARSQPPL